MPNKRNCLMLANFIEASINLKFDMHQPFQPDLLSCGSAGCIGGFAGVLWPTIGKNTLTWNSTALAEQLGISWKQESELCMASYSFILFDSIDRERAVRFLRALADFEGEFLRWIEVK